MKIQRTFTIALIALRRNLMRAILTTLGIMIGIAAVIAMVEIGQGSSSAIAKTIASMGANTLLVQPGTAASGGVSFGAGSGTTLTPEDAEAITREVPSVRAVTPIVRARSQLVYGNKNWVPINIYGTAPEFLDVRDWSPVQEGEMFSQRDVRNAAKVCVVGATIVRELFDGVSPIGKEVRIQNVLFRVVGVLARKGANMMGMDQDDSLIAPWTTIKTRIAGASSSSSGGGQSSATSATKAYPGAGIANYPGQNSASAADTPTPIRFVNVDQILVAARSTDAIPSAMQEITALLRDRHHIRLGEAEDFSIRDMTEMTNALTSTTSLMTRLLLSVALISLVVGGVGIMNIMLVSVTERTREIGLRMAVGAKSRDILQQFIVESITLCLIGGTIGIGFGRLSSALVKYFLHWPVEPSLQAVIVAVIVSVTVGMVFGFYPAWKASRMDPIEALRFE